MTKAALFTTAVLCAAVLALASCHEGEEADPRTHVTCSGDPGGPGTASSSVTKFAAALEDCVDRNGNATIETSLGPHDVLPWGQDGSMLWNTPPTSDVESGEPDFGLGMAIGARATASDGTEDPETKDSQWAFSVQGSPTPRGAWQIPSTRAFPVHVCRPAQSR